LRKKGGRERLTNWRALDSKRKVPFVWGEKKDSAKALIRPGHVQPERGGNLKISRKGEKLTCENYFVKRY